MNKNFIKSVILNSRLYTDFLKIEKSIYLAITNESDYEDKLLPNSSNLMSFKVAMDLKHYYLCKCPRLYTMCHKLFKSKCARVSRLKKRVSNMLGSGTCQFLTLTFTDRYLTSTSAQSRRDYVRKFCNSLDCAYVGNIDFGKTNGREHYHVLVQKDFINYTFWQYGNCDGERVRLDCNEEDTVKLSRYIAKLTNHAIKATTKNSYIIYSRKYK